MAQIWITSRLISITINQWLLPKWAAVAEPQILLLIQKIVQFQVKLHPEMNVTWVMNK